MQRTITGHAVVIAMLLVAGTLVSAQDRVEDGREPLDPSIHPEELRYDYLVDSGLSEDDPANRRFKTVQAAVAAAPAGTEAHPTVIGIRPDVYHLQGGMLTPGLRITKDYITLLGLTNNRRAVVLADNRGLQQGAEDNGYLLDVDATGFTCRNLTIVNYCNVDYDYPGDPGRNLRKRSDVITQAVALVARGDKHVYENVAILSRLDTMFLMAKRAYFKNVYIEGTDDWVGGGGIGYWEDCTLAFPTGNGVMLSMNNAFRRCRFVSGEGMQFYKVEFGSHNRPSVLIDCTVELDSPQGRVAWMREQAPERSLHYSLTSQIQDAYGNPVRICDSSMGTPTYNHSLELSAEQLKAFNPWNLLRAIPGEQPDDWDPAGEREPYEQNGQDRLPYRIELADLQMPTLRTGGAGVPLGAKVTPVYATDPTINWSTSSDLVLLDRQAGPKILVTGNNQPEQAAWVAIDASTANGLRTTAWIYVEPAYIDPPAVVAGPILSAPVAGRITIDYELDLEDRPDQSLVTWSVCDDASGGQERVVAVSRGNEPLKTLQLTPGYVGKHIKASLQPKHPRCEPGKAVSVISEKRITSGDVPGTAVSPNFRHFSAVPWNFFSDGMWAVSENWKIESGEGLENGYGVHSVGPASLFYQNDLDTGDMQLDLLFRPDKTAGQVFSVPGSPEDVGPNNLHADIYIKYDPRTGNGYSLRFWRTTQAAKKCMFQFYRIANGTGTPLDGQQALTGVFKRDTHVVLRVSGDTLSATASNTKDGETLYLESKIDPNMHGGAGMSWSRGTSAICSRFAISYPEHQDESR